MSAADIVVETAEPARRGVSTVRFGPTSGLSALADPARTVVVADSLTRRLLPPGFARVVEVERGEGAKSLSTLERVYAALLGFGAGRDWTVVGLGGGSVSDLAGFAAATWMRGVDFGFVPTTLLSMVDASVGGKNAVDFGGRKNLVGSFAQPRFVLVDLENLRGLPDADMASGLVEALKHGVIEGGSHFERIEAAVSGAGLVDRRALADVVRLSVAFKAGVVARDEREDGERRKLNLGHTIGHAVESVTGLSHGQAVAAGLASAFRLAAERGGPAGDAATSGARVERLLSRLGLPTGLEAARLASERTRGMESGAFREAVAEAVLADKKRSAGAVLFAMPGAIGSVTVEPVSLDDIQDFIRRAP